MKRFRKTLARHRCATFCTATFALTWAFWLITIYPTALPLLGAGENPLSGTTTMLLVGAGMFFPAIGVIVTRLLTGEGFRNAWIKPHGIKRTWKYYAMGWFGPIALVAVGAAAWLFLNPGAFDPSMGAFIDMAKEQAQANGAALPESDTELAQLGWAQLTLVLVAPALNFFTCFGEEWGWRGYLLPHMAESRSPLFSAIVVGVIWGLWHAPITMLGHNYGLGYWGWPVAGTLAMVCFCVIDSVFFSWLTLRAKSCLPAVFAHGALNGCSAAPLMFCAYGANPFVGPAPTGIVGGIGFIAVAIICALSFRRHRNAVIIQRR